MTTITEVISALPDAPDPVNDSPDTFSTKAAAYVLAQTAMVPQVNTWATQANTVAGEVSANATNASSSASSASASAAAASGSATAAAASALTSVNAPGTSGTSTTSLTIGTGSQTFTTQTGKAWVVGQFVTVAYTTSPSADYMFGQITAYNSGTGSMTVNVIFIAGSGTFTAWTIALSGPRGASLGTGGSTGNTGNVTLSASQAALTVAPTGPGFYAIAPDARTLTPGINQFSITNNEQFDYGYQDNTGTTIGWVRPRTTALFILNDNSTQAGTWSMVNGHKTGITSFLQNTTLTNMTSAYIQRFTIDADRDLFIFSDSTVYAVAYKHSTNAWGSILTVRTGVTATCVKSVLVSSTVAMVCSAIGTAFKATTISIDSGTGLALNSGSEATKTLATAAATEFTNIATSGSTYVLPYAKSATGQFLLGITVSGTTPTLGSETATSSNAGSVSNAPVAIALDSTHVLAVGLGSSLMCVKAFSISGTTLTGGTEDFSTTVSGTNFRAFLLGTGNVCAIYSSTASNVGATIIKTTGTAVALSSNPTLVSNLTSTNVTTLLDYTTISTNKVFVSGQINSGGTVSNNIIIDTSGTIGVGTELINTVQSAQPAAIINTSGNTMTVVQGGTTNVGVMSIDASGASPTLNSLNNITVGIAAGGSASATPVVKDRYGNRSAKWLNANGITYYGTFGAQSAQGVSVTANGVAIRDLDAIPIPTAPTFGIEGQNGSKESFLCSIWSGTTGIGIYRQEAAA